MNFKGKAGNYEKPELGSFAAICVRILDLGTQDVVDFQGKKKLMHKVLVSWELDQKMKDGKPFIISKKYTVSLHEKANLRKDLESWRGREFTPEEVDAFTEKSILGKACLISLVASKDGNYVNVGGVTSLPKGMVPPVQVNPSVFLSLDPNEFSQAVFDGLSDKMKATIMLSPEWMELKGEKHEGPVQEEEPSATEEVPF